MVTVLFGDLTDFTGWAEDLDPERVGVVTDRALAALTKAVADVGGYVDKLTGDGIMAVFGAPTAHEDDPERAVRAAAAMQQAITREVAEETGGGQRLGLRVGLNTGEVIAGVQASLSYTVVGDTVNTASRLSDAAGVGAVVAGRETALATMHVASWRALAPLRLKGKREPVAAYELVGLRSRVASRVGVGDVAPFVGREAELGLLVGRLDDVRDRGKPATVMVSGEAGIGKTRLVQELSRHAGNLPRIRVLWGRATPYGEGRDLAPIAEMVRTICGITESDDRQTAAVRVRRTVSRLEHPARAGVVAALADRLIDLLGLQDDTVTTAPRDGATPGDNSRRRASMGLDAASELFAELARQETLVLVVDDVHSASQSLLEALQLIARRLVGRTLLVGIGRTELLSRPSWYAGLPDPEVLALSPLEDMPAERLLRGYLGGSELDPAVTKALLDRAQGNPFFLAELLNLLVDRGILRQGDEGWQLSGALPDDVLPAGVQAVLTARIDSLDPRSKAVLRDAAVLGNRFPPAALSALGHGDGAAVARALDDLVARGLIQATEDSRASYAFVHTLARDVAYAGVPKAERARRHALAARWEHAAAPTGPHAAVSSTSVDQLVAAQAERAVALAVEMALPARDPAWEAKELGYAALVRLGNDALSHDDHRGALDVLTRAFAMGGESVTGELRERSLLAYAEALAQVRDLSAAEAALAEPLASEHLGRRGAAQVVLGDIRRKQGRDDEARSAFVSALASASDAGAERVVGEALRHLGLLDYRVGRLREAEVRFRESLELARRIGDRRGEGWALQHLAWSATTRGDYDLANEALAEGIGLFLAMEDSGGISWCLGTEAFVRLLQGRLTEARALVAGLLPTVAAQGDAWSEAACLTIDAMAAAELGDVEVADFSARRAVGLFGEIGDGWGAALAWAAIGSAARAAGDNTEAIAALEAALATTKVAGNPLVGALVEVVLGLVLLAEGRISEAAVMAQDTTSNLRALDVEPHAVAGATVLSAMVLRAQGSVAAAASILAEAARDTEVASLLFSPKQVLAHLAGALLDLGQLADAKEAIEAAMARPAQDVRSAVVALRVLGAVRAADGDPVGARSALTSALDVAMATGHRGEVAATERALAALPAEN